MNQFPGVIGRKIGMTQIFTEDGSVVPCTVVESNISVVGKRTQEKDGYDAIIVGSGELKEKHTNKPLAGAFKKANVTPRRTLRELRCTPEFAASVEVGSELKVDQLFEVGQFVDVQGTTKGRVAATTKGHTLYAADKDCTGKCLADWTPFRAAWLDHGWAAPAPAPDRVPWAEVPTHGVPAEPATDVDLPAAGEAAARARWARFRDERLADYGTDRDRPDLDGTSAVSAPHMCMA